MAYEALRTLLDVVEVFRAGLTQPSYNNMLVIFAGWLLTAGPHAVTEALVVTDVARRTHHERFHRFFSRARWSTDELGRLLFVRLLKLLAESAPIRIVIDDTTAEKKGPQIFGLGCHLDAVRSTKGLKVFCFGHCWVTLSLQVRVPFSTRVWSVPLLFRLYRTKKESAADPNAAYHKKTELARELLNVFVEWVNQRRVELAADSAYCNDTVLRDMPSNVVVFGAMRPDAVLTTLPQEPRPKGKPGRPRKRGTLLPKPEQLAGDDKQPWQSCTACLYGETKTVQYKTLCAQWYRACGIRLLRIVVVKVETGTIALRVFFCTDPNLSIQEILEGYAGRWSIEVCFRTLKQLLGFADSSARLQKAVERTAPFVGLMCTALVVWAIEGAWKSPLAAPPVRPWYQHKRGLSFADILRAAQRTLRPMDVLDPRRSLNNLRKSQPPRRAARQIRPQRSRRVA